MRSVLPSMIALVVCGAVLAGCKKEAGTTKSSDTLSAEDFVTVVNAINDDDPAPIKALYAKGVNLNACRVNNNETFLSLALRSGERAKRVVQVMLEAGADVKAADAAGTTPLHWAARYCAESDMVKALVDAGADVNARNAYGDTPLHAACDNGTLQVVKFLVERGADPMAQTNDGVTGAAIAEKTGRLDIAQYLRGLKQP